jgi:hypothetical protein
MNMEENRSTWQYLEFNEICLQQRLRKLPVSDLKTMSNGNVLNLKLVGNFLLILIDIKFVQNRVRMLQKITDYRRVQKQFRDSESW